MNINRRLKNEGTGIRKSSYGLSRSIKLSILFAATVVMGIGLAVFVPPSTAQNTSATTLGASKSFNNMIFTNTFVQVDDTDDPYARKRPVTPTEPTAPSSKDSDESGTEPAKGPVMSDLEAEQLKASSMVPMVRSERSNDANIRAVPVRVNSDVEGAGSCPTGPVMGTLSGGDPTFNRPVGSGGGCSPSGVGTDVHYDVFSYNLSGPGPHDLFASTVGGSSVDTVLVFYQAGDGSQNPFNPAQPCLNSVAWNDDFSGLQSQINASGLGSGWVDIVLTTFANGVTGAYTMNVSSMSCGGTVTCQPQVLADGSFEGGSPNANWNETSTNFGTPLCTVGGCGTGGGSAGPRTGGVWSWFGGIPANETGTVSQQFTISPVATSATLNFYTRWGRVSGAFDDVLNVRVDGNIIQTYTEPNTAEPGYSLQSIDMSAYMDGVTRTLTFEGISIGGTTTNLNLDDVSLNVEGCPVDPVTPSSCAPVVDIFTNNTPVSISDNTTITSNITVSGVGTYLTDVDLMTNITHTWNADLDMTITSPSGTVVTLSTDNGGSNDNVFAGTVWDDSANPGGQVPYSSNNGLVTDNLYSNNVLASPLVPEEAFGAFIGENPNGVWTLRIHDDASGDTGALNDWSITVSTLESAPIIAAGPTFTNNTPVVISSSGTPVVSSTINVSGLGTELHDINATTFIEHTWAADLDVTLTSPAGTVVTLTTDNGGSFDNVFNGTVWDDDANPGGQVPYTSNNGLVTDHSYSNNVLASPLVPEEAMAAFRGENPNGTWTLTISDDAGGDGGALTSWSLDIQTFECLSVSGVIRQYVPGGPNLNLGGVTVTMSGDANGVAITAADGSYSFGNLPVGGTYIFTPSGTGTVSRAEGGGMIFDPTTRTFPNLVTTVQSANFLAYTADGTPGQLPREARIVNGFGIPGQPINTTVTLASRGDESEMEFSLSYDQTRVHTPVVTCGASIPGCTLGANTSTNGKISVFVKPTVAFAAGLREVIKIVFQSFPTAAQGNGIGVPINFTDDPLARKVLDIDNVFANPLPIKWTDGFIVFQQGFEGDMAPRFAGNGSVVTTDLQIHRQMVVGTLTPENGTNEFQRADVAPLATKGDGLLNAGDIAQMRNYAVGNTPLMTAGGPTGPGFAAFAETEPGEDVARGVAVRGGSGTVNSRIEIPVELNAQGDETAAFFTLTYDATKLANPGVVLSGGLPSDTVLTVNAAEPGRVTVLVDSGYAFARGEISMVNVGFDILPTAASGSSMIDIVDLSIADAGANDLISRRTGAMIEIAGPNPMGIDISGRVLSPDGRGLRNAQVTVTDENGVSRTVTSGSFGGFRFENVNSGGTMTITVSSRLYRFAPRVFVLSDHISGLDLTGIQ